MSSKHTPNEGQKRGLAYWIFFLLFSPDFWRILAGLAFAGLLTPRIVPPDLHAGGLVMLYVMMATIGWAVSGVPARWISNGLKKWMLGGMAP